VFSVRRLKKPQRFAFDLLELAYRTSFPYATSDPDDNRYEHHRGSAHEQHAIH
jgi:hypothetical protein